ncbi:MAG: hypothetical protein JWN76_2127 [Chitinophagaceae bacterium]|nr:hypothetical protein [Chitinophagaceae bacterium]
MKKIIIILLSGFLFTSFHHSSRFVKAKHKLQLVFHNQFSGKEMIADSSYQNAFGENFILKGFRYYISNISVKEKNGRLHNISAKYFLVDMADDSSQTIELAIDKKDFIGLQFMLGVDSLRNISGTQTGVLDPARGMFWTWNSGYIMAKLEGISGDSKANSHLVTYHVGGFKKDQQTNRVINLNFIESHELAGNIFRVDINADAAAWFNGEHKIKIAEYPICHSPGALAVQLADNYSKMFSLAGIR